MGGAGGAGPGYPFPSMRLAAALLALAAALPAQEEKTTASGLTYVVVKAGTPRTAPVPGEIVRVHYTARRGDEVLETTREGEPLQFVLGRRRVAAALDEGVGLMDVGSVFRFVDGSDAPVTYEVELLAVPTPPEFRKADPTKQKTTASGLKVEVLKPGAGDTPRPDQGVELRYARWTPDGHLLECTEAGRILRGAVHSFPWKFMPEAIGMMKPGTALRLEVPAALGYTEEDVDAVWELELLGVRDLPAFPAADPAGQRRTASGLVYEVIREGDGLAPAPEGWVTVHYTGWVQGGVLYDSSVARGEPAVFRLKTALPGWRVGLLQMKEGAVYRLTIPPQLAYGTSGQGVIPPDATLVVLIELIKAGR